MVNKMRITRGAGGNQHPIAVKQFILDRLARVGEDYFSGLHQAYKEELDRIAKERVLAHRRKNEYYHHPTYFSFYKKARELMREGLIEFSGREEAVDDPRFANWENPPKKKYVRLARR